MRARCILLLLVGLCAPRLEAQSPAQLPAISAGTRVRVDAPGIVTDHFVGTLLFPASDSLLLARDDGPPVTIRSAQITSLEVSRGKSRARGAVMGLLVGAPIGVAVGMLFSREPEVVINGSPRKNQQNDTRDMGMAGAGIGLIIGGAIGRERWVRLPLPGVR